MTSIENLPTMEPFLKAPSINTKAEPVSENGNANVMSPEVDANTNVTNPEVNANTNVTNPEVDANTNTVENPVVAEEGIKYTADRLMKMSIEYVYNAIRFSLFQSVDPEQLKALFMDMINTPVKSPYLIDEFIQHLNGGDFGALATFVRSNKLDGVEAAFKEFNIPQPINRNFSKVFDIYLKQTEPDLAFGLFRYILFLPFDTQENYDLFLADVETATPFLIKEMATATIWNSMIL